MHVFQSLAFGVAGLMAAVCAVLLTALILRDPLGPRWLRTETAAQAISLVTTLVFGFATAHSLNMLVAADHRIATAVLIVLALVFGWGAALWEIFGIGQRLRRADAGQSPFRSKGPTGPATPAAGPTAATPA